MVAVVAIASRHGHGRDVTVAVAMAVAVRSNIDIGKAGELCCVVLVGGAGVAGPGAGRSLHGVIACLCAVWPRDHLLDLVGPACY